MLQTAATLLFLIGIIHSVLGERYILIRLFCKGTVRPWIINDLLPEGTLLSLGTKPRLSEGGCKARAYVTFAHPYLLRDIIARGYQFGHQ